jgi:peptidoglycan/LPS O-acetylase OafA/YrhL
MVPRRSLVGLHLLADHFPPLHGLRALAIVSVLQIHVTLTLVLTGLMREDDPIFARSTHVWFGMDLFFVLSGFLIGTLLAPATSGEARGGMLRFYARRAFRIVPLYYVVLTALVLLLPTLPGQRAMVGYEYAYLTNYAPFTVPPIMPAAWSLCVEEHFYLAVPLVSAALSRLPRPGWRMGALLVLWLAGLAVRYAVFTARSTPWTPNELTVAIYIRTHTRFDTLVAGVLLAQVQGVHGARIRAALRRPALKRALALVPIGCCWLLLGPLAARHDLSTIFAWGTVTSVMYFTLVLLLLNSEGPVTRFLSWRGFLRFATLGYGIYLVHPPLISIVVVPVAAVMRWRWHLPLGVVWSCALALLLVVASAVAYALHLAVEKPALWLRDRVAR